MNQPCTLSTPRLLLRQWRDADLDAFAALNADARVMAHFPSTIERCASDAMALRCRDLIDERGWGFWAAELKADGSFIGFIGLHVPAPDLPFSPCVEIGWRLAFRYWGQGYASEGAREALRFGFQWLRLEEIVAFTALTNMRSQAVMRRIGMQDRGERFAHPALPEGHALREHYLMRLTRREWEGLRSLG
jgi:RimJ/RimL family protein N-acetyltransferase